MSSVDTREVKKSMHSMCVQTSTDIRASICEADVKESKIIELKNTSNKCSGISQERKIMFDEKI
jgi:hypothetical protein